MKTIVSDTPAEEAAAHINATLALHAHEPILLLVSGGSSLSVVKLLHSSKLSTNTLIAMTDEHFSIDAKESNFYQFQKTTFYKKALERGIQFIDSVPREQENIKEFTQRLELQLEAFFAAHPTYYAICLLGIGEDGHTAGIFPLTENVFETTYRASDDHYVSVILESSTYNYNQRVTITPVFIEDVLDEVILYAVGEKKCLLILETLHSNTRTHNQLPALIPAQHPHSILFTDCKIKHS